MKLKIEEIKNINCNENVVIMNEETRDLLNIKLNNMVDINNIDIAIVKDGIKKLSINDVLQRKLNLNVGDMIDVKILRIE